MQGTLETVKCPECGGGEWDGLYNVLATYECNLRRREDGTLVGESTLGRSEIIWDASEPDHAFCCRNCGHMVEVAS